MLKHASLGSTKFRPRALDAFVPIKEWSEFSGIEHNSDLQIALYEWPMLYGEALLVIMVVALFSPPFMNSSRLFLFIKTMRFGMGLLSTIDK